MAKDYREAIRIVGRKLLSGAESALDNPTGKGESREDLVRRMLATRMGSSFAVSKAEVIDSAGRTTGEFVRRRLRQRDRSMCR